MKLNLKIQGYNHVAEIEFESELLALEFLKKEKKSFFKNGITEGCTSVKFCDLTTAACDVRNWILTGSKFEILHRVSVQVNDTEDWVYPDPRYQVFDPFSPPMERAVEMVGEFLSQGIPVTKVQIGGVEPPSVWIHNDLSLEEAEVIVFNPYNNLLYKKSLEVVRSGLRERSIDVLQEEYVRNKKFIKQLKEIVVS